MADVNELSLDKFLPTKKEGAIVDVVKPEASQNDGSVVDDKTKPEETVNTVDTTDEEKAALESYIGTNKPDAAKTDIPELPESIKNELNTLRSKVQDYEGNDVVKSVYEFLKSGGKPEELLIESGKTYDNASDDVVIQDYMSYIYSKPEEQSKIKPEIEAFNKKYTLGIERKPQIDSFKNKLNEIYGRKENTTFKTVIESKLAPLRHKQQEQEKGKLQQQELMNNSWKDIQTSVPAIKEYNGVQIPESDMPDIMKMAYYHQPATKTSDGKVVLDTKAGIDMALKYKYFDKYIEQAKKEAFLAGRRSYIKPSTEQGSSTQPANGAGETAFQVFAKSNTPAKFLEDKK